MFSKRRVLLACLAAGCLLGAGCKRAAAPVERLAILPAENLTADESLDWVGQALAAIAAEELTGSPVIDARRVESLRDAVTFRATRILHSYFTGDGGHLQLHVVLEDPAARKMIKEFSVFGSLATGIAPLARQVAAQLATPVRRFGTGNRQAIQAYAEALLAQAPKQRTAALDRALQADPDFSEALLAKAEMLVAQGKKRQAHQLIHRALAKRKLHDKLTRARLQYLDAIAEGAPEKVLKALEKLAELTPADASIAERVATILMNRRRWAEAASWYQRAARADPGRGDLWNSLAYAQAYNGDLAAARESLARYRATDPDSPNPLDSLGEVNFYLGHLAAAERYFLETYDKDPSFQGSVCLVKAARCRLMMGDPGGADKLFQQYARLRRQLHDARIGYRTAQWDFSLGRRRQAIEELGQLAGRADVPREVSVAAHAQVAVWALLTGDLGRARRHAALARRTADSRVPPPMVVLCEFLTQAPAGAAEWKRRADEAFPNPAEASLKRQALLFALLLAKHYPEANVVAAESYKQARAFSAAELRVLYAGTLIETGEFERARKLLAVNPLIQPGTESLFYVLVFPRILYLRAVVEQHFGDRQRAAANYRLFLDYTSNTPLIFDDEATARRARSAALSKRNDPLPHRRAHALGARG